MSNHNAFHPKADFQPETFLTWLCAQLQMTERAHGSIINTIQITCVDMKEEDKRSGRLSPLPRLTAPGFPRDEN